MNEIQQPPIANAIHMPALVWAVRFSVVSIVLGLSYLTLRASLGIGSFERLFADMPDGAPLPSLTRFILAVRGLFVAMSVCVPLAAIGTLFVRRVTLSFYIIGTLALLTLTQWVVLYKGLNAPLAGIITHMSDQP